MSTEQRLFPVPGFLSGAIEGEIKLPTLCRRHFQIYFVAWKVSCFVSNFSEVYSWGSNLLYDSIGSVKGVTPRRRQVIPWYNVDQQAWRHMSPIGIVTWRKFFDHFQYHRHWTHHNKLSSETWWRHQMETFSALLTICAGNSPVPGEFPAQRPVTRSFDVYFDLRPNKRLRKQSWGWWFETPSRPLWRHRNELSSEMSLEFFKLMLPCYISPHILLCGFPGTSKYCPMWPWKIWVKWLAENHIKILQSAVYIFFGMHFGMTTLAAYGAMARLPRNRMIAPESLRNPEA